MFRRTQSSIQRTMARFDFRGGGEGVDTKLARIGGALAVMAMVAACNQASPSTANPSQASPSTANTSQASPSTAGDDVFRVTSIKLDAKPEKYTGACPIKVEFPGQITVAGGAGTVTWVWEGSDGSRSPEQHTTFEGPGTNDVSSTWTIDETQPPDGYAFEAIDILDPTINRSDTQISTEANFFVRCT